MEEEQRNGENIQLAMDASLLMKGFASDLVELVQRHPGVGPEYVYDGIMVGAMLGLFGLVENTDASHAQVIKDLSEGVEFYVNKARALIDLPALPKPNRAARRAAKARLS